MSLFSYFIKQYNKINFLLFYNLLIFLYYFVIAMHYNAMNYIAGLLHHLEQQDRSSFICCILSEILENLMPAP